MCENLVQGAIYTTTMYLRLCFFFFILIAVFKEPSESMISKHTEMTPKRKFGVISVI